MCLSSIFSFFQITPSGCALKSWKLTCSITWTILFGAPFYRYLTIIGVLCKKVFLEISQNSQENTCARVSFSIKLQAFSCEFYEISKNTFFTEHLCATAIVNVPLSVSWIFTEQLLLKHPWTQFLSLFYFVQVFDHRV